MKSGLLSLMAAGAATMVVLSGCGGSGNTFSQFQGTWSGPFQVYNPGGGSSVESSGTMTVVFDSFGGAQITMVRTDSNNQTQVFNNGFVDRDRLFRYVWRWNNTNDRETRGEIRINGNFLQGATTDRRIPTTFAGGGTGGMEFTLTRQ